MAETSVYKILSDKDWQVAQTLGHTKTALDEDDGYVHLSTRVQVSETLRLHYAGQEHVRLLEYTLEAFGSHIRWEESRGGELFPHLYAPLRLEAAKRVWALETGPDNIPTLPRDIDE